MQLNSAEVGTRYGDDSGWERRVMIDKQEGRLEIEVNGSKMSAHPRDIDWLIDALETVRESVFS